MAPNPELASGRAALSAAKQQNCSVSKSCLGYVLHYTGGIVVFTGEVILPTEQGNTLFINKIPDCVNLSRSALRVKAAGVSTVTNCVHMFPQMETFLRKFVPIFPATVPTHPATLRDHPESVPRYPFCVPVLPATIPVFPATERVHPETVPCLPFYVPILPATVPIHPATVPCHPFYVPVLPGTVPTHPETERVHPATVPCHPFYVPVLPATVPVHPETVLYHPFIVFDSHHYIHYSKTMLNN
jgi:hypothetical protein